MTKKLFGREEELTQLRQAVQTEQPQLMAVYGRRRIGKTALVEAAFHEKFSVFKLEGLEGLATTEQLRSCEHDLRAFFGISEISSADKNHKLNWHTFFDLLYEALQDFRGPIVVFFDEFQWMANMRSTLVSIFKKYWDNKFSKLSHCHFVLCGSVSSFIVKKVIESKALYGRIGVELELLPLSVEDIACFFSKDVPKEEILEAYMTLGGVPKYYEVYDHSKSLLQNYERHFFRKGGFFYSEIKKLFVSHFGRNPQYFAIVRALRQEKLTLEQIASRVKISSGGNFSNKVKELELAGFIGVTKSLGAKKKLYTISDPYLRFYFSFIEPNLEKINSGHYNFYRDTQKSLAAWYGYAFENLCLAHSQIISNALSFSGVDYRVGPWLMPGSENQQACQVDLAFLRADRTITVCELKFQEKLRVKEIVERFKRREEALSESFPKHRIHRVLISGKSIADSTRELALDYFHDVLVAEQVFMPS